MVPQPISDWTISKVEARVRAVRNFAFEPYLGGLHRTGEPKAERIGELCYKVKPQAVAKCASHEQGMLIQKVVKKESTRARRC